MHRAKFHRRQPWHHAVRRREARAGNRVKVIANDPDVAGFSRAWVPRQFDGPGIVVLRLSGNRRDQEGTRQTVLPGYDAHRSSPGKFQRQRCLREAAGVTLRMAGADFRVVRAAGSDSAGWLPGRCKVPPQTLDAIAAGNLGSGYERSARPQELGHHRRCHTHRLYARKIAAYHGGAKPGPGRTFVADLVRSRRLELPRGYPHKHLKLARLPFRHDRNVV